MRQPSDVVKSRNNLLTYLLGLVVAIVGGVLLYLASPNKVLGGEGPFTAIYQALGVALFTTVSIGVIWDLFVRRSFLEEMKIRLAIAGQIDSAGIIGYTNQFYNLPEWQAYFSSSHRLDIFFAYAATWRNVNEANLREFVNRGGKIRVVLPNPDDKSVMTELAHRFDYELDDMVSKEKDAVNSFVALRDMHKGDVRIWLIAKAPLFTFYRFDDTIILTLYNHRSGRGDVPTFVASKGGKLYDTVTLDFEEMVKSDGLARPY